MDLATSYELEDAGLNSRWGKIFLFTRTVPSSSVVHPASSSVLPGLFVGGKLAGE